MIWSVRTTYQIATPALSRMPLVTRISSRRSAKGSYRRLRSCRVVLPRRGPRHLHSANVRDFGNSGRSSVGHEGPLRVDSRRSRSCPAVGCMTVSMGGETGPSLGCVRPMEIVRRKSPTL
jgi:hypothetical protein